MKMTKETVQWGVKEYPVYECEFCGWKSAATNEVHECAEKRQAIQEWHEEEFSAGVL